MVLECCGTAILYCFYFRISTESKLNPRYNTSGYAFLIGLANKLQCERFLMFSLVASSKMATKDTGICFYVSKGTRLVDGSYNIINHILFVLS